jgi:hypothetical protein
MESKFGAVFRTQSSVPNVRAKRPFMKLRCRREGNKVEPKWVESEHSYEHQG